MSRWSSLGLLLALGLLAGCATQVRVVPNRAHPEATPGSTNRDGPISAAIAALRQARAVEATRPKEAAGHYLTAASLAYHDFGAVAPPPGVGPAVSRTVRTYNEAALGLVLSLQKLPGGLRTNHVLSVKGEPVRVLVQGGDTDSDPGYYDRWLAADQWRQIGLAHSYRLDGLGARLVAVRTNRQETPIEVRQPDEGIFHSSTAILRFPAEPDGSGPTTQTAQLVFYNPRLTPRLEVGGELRPLAADYTIPVAMLLSHTRPLLKTRWSALIHPVETLRPHRLYLFEPYSPDRIPIIMVHGLYSTPLAWQQLTNELLGDPEIRERYQIWHYLYPTGLPFLTSAADFRDEVEAVRRLVDPADHDFATHHMVVIGHSMGGLLARTLITDSGDGMWNSTFAIPLAQLDPHLEGVPELRRMFYFQAQPYVRRAIFIAVPHHGSRTADSLAGRLMSHWVTLPKTLHQFIANLQKAVPGLLKPETVPLFRRGYPDGIRVLAPQTPGLVALARLPVAAGTPFHSIIGDRGLGGGTNSSDGVVTYASSHLPGAQSETIVPVNHRACDKPATIAEVKRILKLHVAGLRLEDGIVRP